MDVIRLSYVIVYHLSILLRYSPMKNSDYAKVATPTPCLPV